MRARSLTSRITVAKTIKQLLEQQYAQKTATRAAPKVAEKATGKATGKAVRKTSVDAAVKSKPPTDSKAETKSGVRSAARAANKVPGKPLQVPAAVRKTKTLPRRRSTAPDRTRESEAQQAERARRAQLRREVPLEERAHVVTIRVNGHVTGYQLRVGSGKGESSFFGVSSYGGEEAAHAAALQLASYAGLSVIPGRGGGILGRRSRMTRLEAGISMNWRTFGGGLPKLYLLVSWKEGERKRGTALSVDKNGLEKPLRRAIAIRVKAGAPRPDFQELLATLMTEYQTRYAGNVRKQGKKQAVKQTQKRAKSAAPQRRERS